MMQHLYYYKANLKRIIDGDTIIVDLDLGLATWQHGVRLRLAGVDTPEIRGESKPEGIEAREYVRQILPNELIVHTTKFDSFGRAIAEVYFNLNEEWVSLSDRLVEMGMVTGRVF